MLYRATGKVLCVVPAGRGGAVIPALREIRDRRHRSHPAFQHAAPPPESEPVRQPFGGRAAFCPRLARRLRPRPGIDTNPWEHDRAALHELYLLGPRREFGLPQLRRLLSFLEEQRKCR